MSQTQSFTGSCHCGAVRFRAQLAPPERALACNCSICSRMGWRLAFVGPDAFELLQGREALQDYQFGAERAHHVFCRTCGTHAFGHGTMGDGTETVMLNLRCMPAIDVEALPVDWFDGASL